MSYSDIYLKNTWRIAGDAGKGISKVLRAAGFSPWNARLVFAVGNVQHCCSTARSVEWTREAGVRKAMGAGRALLPVLNTLADKHVTPEIDRALYGTAVCKAV